LAKKKASPKPENEEQLTFEQSLEKLETVVRRLEEGQLGLGESLECYEQGVKHLKRCYRALEEAERKIELLAGVDADGNPVTEAFDDADMALEEKAAARSQRRTRPADGPANEGGVDESRGLF
jgi:exodeoxyribonuclease VII small subunit